MKISFTVKNWLRFYGCCFILCSTYQLIILIITLSTAPNSPEIKTWHIIYGLIIGSSMVGNVLGMFSLLINNKRPYVQIFTASSIIFLLLGGVGIVFQARVIHQTRECKISKITTDRPKTKHIVTITPPTSQTPAPSNHQSVPTTEPSTHTTQPQLPSSTQPRQPTEQLFVPFVQPFVPRTRAPSRLYQTLLHGGQPTMAVKQAREHKAHFPCKDIIQNFPMVLFGLCLAGACVQVILSASSILIVCGGIFTADDYEEMGNN